MTKLMIRYSSIIWNEVDTMHVVFDDVSAVKLEKLVGSYQKERQINTQ